MNVNEELIDKLAKLSRLSFDPEEKKARMKDLERMLGFVEQLKEVDTEGIDPLIHINPEVNVLREDQVTEELSQNDALKNAPEHDSFYFKVPKVVENTDK